MNVVRREKSNNVFAVYFTLDHGHDEFAVFADDDDIIILSLYLSIYLFYLFYLFYYIKLLLYKIIYIIIYNI